MPARMLVCMYESVQDSCASWCVPMHTCNEVTALLLTSARCLSEQSSHSHAQAASGQRHAIQVPQQWWEAGLQLGQFTVSEQFVVFSHRRTNLKV